MRVPAGWPPDWQPPETHLDAETSDHTTLRFYQAAQSSHDAVRALQEENSPWPPWPPWCASETAAVTRNSAQHHGQTCTPPLDHPPFMPSSLAR
ncbi:hypothetical protein PMIN07_007762 [Paraphaeosphaeria minitans]|uniref:Uncharacterized protein n=1 Tax=Paraphaeosphaeria minitans TaxID=565426 RepID=A0A9P6KSE7_9PLEO|nr:hypothetical protein PMIN01_04590 [Paraphaeosphaeria minitans]